MCVRVYVAVDVARICLLVLPVEVLALSVCVCVCVCTRVASEASVTTMGSCVRETCDCAVRPLQ